MYCIVDRYTKKNAFVTSVKKRVQMHLGKLQEERMESIGRCYIVCLLDGS